MQIKFSSLVACTSTFVYASAAVSTATVTSSNFIVFGDSLVDNGNTGKLLNTTVYWDGRFSNSYVWDEYTAKLLGMTLVNNAYGDATSNNNVTSSVLEGITIPSFHDQVTNWLSSNPSPSQSNLDYDVIQIEIGSNDIINNIQGLSNGTVDIDTLATSVATSISTDIKSLIDAGYQNINLWNIPAIELTPMVLAMNGTDLMAPVVQTMNSAIAKLVQSVFDNSKSTTRSTNIFDLHTLMTTCLQSQVLSAFGITDHTDACYTTDSNNKPSICSNPDEHFFYDDIHPASRMHYLWGVSAAYLTRDASTSLDTNGVTSIIKSFSIGSSSKTDNIIVNGITPSESADIPAESDGVGAGIDGSSSDHSTSSAAGLRFTSCLAFLALATFYFL
ncbi:hypothetical protein EV175_000080 [Coemansia sp. RSA 1933]|nr:hypothetical protein EV175_000080 [Coemansia sp. RSA 1933]